MSTSKEIALLLSGGIDSALLLKWLVEHEFSVYPIYVHSGFVWEPREQKAAKEVAAMMDVSDRLVSLSAPMQDVLKDHWSISGADVPGANSPDEAVYIPGRNLTLLQKTSLWCHQHGIQNLAIGTLAANPFGDATRLFLISWQRLFAMATGSPVEISQPFGNCTKAEILRRADQELLRQTFSCLSPQQELHCGRCNKCAERSRAFREVGRDDPTTYATDL